jgi:hypothetical protein
MAWRAVGAVTYAGAGAVQYLQHMQMHKMMNRIDATAARARM